MNKFLFLLLWLPLQLFGANKIVGGSVPEVNHPGKFNTVALLKAHDKKVFCTGSLISKRMILTAKHCLMDRELKDVLVFFGDDTNSLNTGTIVSPKAMKVRKPIDWEMTFPSFDVAWIELSQDAPDGFSPLPILSSKDELPSENDVHLVGHGNSSEVDGKVVAGKKFKTTTQLKKYYDNSRFFHILLFEGKEGQGACHGDSGGPAYVRTKKGWAIIGITNGFDIVLTPKAMKRTSDEDFPYRIDCKANQNLYSFAGAHGEWIEKTSKQKIQKTSAFKSFDSTVTGDNKSVYEWCQRRDFGSPKWNFLKLLLDQKVDKMDQNKAEAFYNNCHEIEDYLTDLKEIRINGEKTLDAHYSLGPLHLLNIDLVKIFDFDIKHIDFKQSLSTTIEKLQLNRMKISSLNFLSESLLNFKKLDVSNNPIEQLFGLERHQEIESLDISRTLITDFTLLTNFKDLKELDLTFTSLKNTDILKNFSLTSLSLGSEHLNRIDLAGQNKLEFLSISSMNNLNINFLKDLPALRVANLAHLDIADLSVFSMRSFNFLEKLNLSGNPIDNLSSLKELVALESLRLFGTPLAQGRVPKGPHNCPVTGPAVLVKFCK